MLRVLPSQPSQMFWRASLALFILTIQTPEDVLPVKWADENRSKTKKNVSFDLETPNEGSSEDEEETVSQKHRPRWRGRTQARKPVGKKSGKTSSPEDCAGAVSEAPPDGMSNTGARSMSRYEQVAKQFFPLDQNTLSNYTLGQPFRTSFAQTLPAQIPNFDEASLSKTYTPVQALDSGGNPIIAWVPMDGPQMPTSAPPGPTEIPTARMMEEPDNMVESQKPSNLRIFGKFATQAAGVALASLAMRKAAEFIVRKTLRP